MSTQSYANHTHQPLLAGVAAGFWLIAASGFAAAWLGHSWGSALGVASLLLAALCLISISRVYTTRLQDRIIRLEEQVRAQRLLGPAQLAQWQTLGVKQIAALRFASDAEFAALLDRTMTEHLKPDAIKRAVTEWRADHHRT
jgi:hypothetical protein